MILLQQDGLIELLYFIVIVRFNRPNLRAYAKHLEKICAAFYEFLLAYVLL